MSHHPSDIIRILFKDIGSPSQSQRERLDRMKRNCLEDPNPHDCYLTLDMGAYPVVSWRHNTKAHFGKDHEHLTYAGFLTLIHPAWKELFFRFGEVAYTISDKEPAQLQKHKVTFTQKVPLLTPEGYYWYDQVAVPGSLDRDGRLCSHLNFYRRLERYENLLPGPPTIYAGGEPDSYLMAHFREEGKNFVEPFLREFLTDQQVEVLNRYRQLPAVRSKQKPSRETGSKALGYRAKVTYDKALQEIKTNIRDHFQGFRADTAHDFALFLNEYFPSSDG